MPVSRREFLQTTVAGAALSLLPRRSYAAGTVLRHASIGASGQAMSDLKAFSSHPAFELVPSRKGLTMRVSTRGAGRKNKQELNLTVNLNGFDEFVQLALDLKLGYDRARERATERIQRK